ncbi:hypothetical protein LMG27177_04696 [Paraburkholderia fynbosensis]|uniref:Uncharacterized protein n=1 Tax=Paraburkholderia fynbosensis TaxID=1200993 RepID=A0A6J5GLW5_9BURK|nr:hypothetical protein LMG27177_04696 [Paraburkholderia fynbosensis]
MASSPFGEFSSGQQSHASGHSEKLVSYPILSNTPFGTADA